MSEVRCELCRANFPEDRTVQEPVGVIKCESCAAEYPKARTREEIQVVNPNKAETMSEDRVRDIVYEIVEDAGLKRNVCEKCHEKFFSNTPMQKLCDKCKVKADEKKTDKKKETK